MDARPCRTHAPAGGRVLRGPAQGGPHRTGGRMSSGSADPEDSSRSLETVGRLAHERGLWVAAAESLTTGRVASRLGAGANASKWFRGGVVAYDERVKFDVLGVEPGPLVTEVCADQMA